MLLLQEVISSYSSFIKSSQHLSAHTLKAYGIDLEQFGKFIGSDRVAAEIDKGDLNRFYEHMTRLELAPATIKRKLACVQSMFKWSERESLIASTPFNKFDRTVKLPKKLPRNVPRSDLRMMLQHAQQPEHKPNDSCLSPCPTTKFKLEKKRDLNKFTALISIELMLVTGVRVGELVGLKLSDVFLIDGKLKINGKGSRERLVYIPTEGLRELLSAYIKARILVEPDNAYLLVNSRGNRASTQFIRKLINDLSKRAKTQLKVTPHMLRHSAACELIESGTDIRFVQRLLGHSSISTTEIYTHVSDTALREKIEEANVRERIMS